jgi:ATPase subunit of ABC transporter with duplicated ATPase domains
MPASLVARSISVSRGARLVLDSIDITLAPGHRVGLVGPNGVGKSTLLASLAGDVEPERGSVAAAPPSATIGLLPQEPVRSVDETVRAFLGRRTAVTGAQNELDAAIADLAEGGSGADDRYSLALDRWLSLGAADLDARVGVTWAELGLPERLLEQPTASLSGGEAARCSLASLLLSRFDVFLLDEPTNDLDLDGLDRLEAWMRAVEAPMLLVSHDRSLLQRVITDVFEIDHHTHRGRWYSGGWASFLEERDRDRLHARERFDEFDTKRRGLATRAQREREWAQQGVAKVARSDEPDKYIRHFKIDQTEQLAGRAARTQQAIDRLEEVDEPRDPWELRLTIPDAGRSGDIVVWSNGAVGKRGGFRLGPVDVTVHLGDRVAIQGPNGGGKSTLLAMLLGRLEPVEGVTGTGSNVIVGEVEQARLRFVRDGTLLEAFMHETGMTVPDVRRLLAKFDLGADDVAREAASLSPGERTRASLALLMANGANLLVLDEPTNHLDLEAIEQLELALDTFAGTVLLVTHDRSMLDRVRITRTFDVVDGVVTERR